MLVGMQVKGAEASKPSSTYVYMYAVVCRCVSLCVCV